MQHQGVINSNHDGIWRLIWNRGKRSFDLMGKKPDFCSGCRSSWSRLLSCSCSCSFSVFSDNRPNEPMKTEWRSIPLLCTVTWLPVQKADRKCPVRPELDWIWEGETAEVVEYFRRILKTAHVWKTYGENFEHLASSVSYYSLKNYWISYVFGRKPYNYWVTKLNNSLI